MTPPLVVAYALTKYHQRTQTFVDLEITGLRGLGAEVHVVAMEHGHDDRGADPYVRYLDSVQDRWGPVVAAHLRLLVLHPMRAARFARRLVGLRSELGSAAEQVPWWRLAGVASELERAGVSRVHAHFGWSGATAACLLGSLLGVPWSMTLHAKDIFTKRHNLARKLSWADVVVTVSEYNRRWIAERWPDSAPIVVLTCGVEEPRSGGPAQHATDIVSVARLIPKKGLDTLVRAAAVLRDRGRPARVTIVGDGPLRGELVALAQELDVADLVTFPGEQPHDAALDVIAAARVFCLPCRVAADGDRDAMPTVIIEAMMRGVPVVSTLEVGVPELVDDSCGRLVAADDPVALAAALDEVLADPSLARALGERAAQRARERFALDGQVRRLARLLSSG